MKKIRPFFLLIIVFSMTAFSTGAYCQAHCDLLQANNAAAIVRSSNANYWFGLMELPFLFIAVRVGGSIIDYQMGFTQAAVFNPQFNETVSPIADFQYRHFPDGAGKATTVCSR